MFKLCLTLLLVATTPLSALATLSLLASASHDDGSVRVGVREGRLECFRGLAGPCRNVGWSVAWGVQRPVWLCIVEPNVLIVPIWWIAPGWALALFARVRRRRGAPGEVLCPACGYDVRACPSARCSECGLLLSHAH